MSKENPYLGRKPKNIRSKNRQLLIDLYRNNEFSTVTEIAKEVCLSRTTVLKINQELLADDIIVISGKGDSTIEGGKKPIVYQYNASKSMIITFYIQYNSILFRLYDLLFNIIVEDSIPIKENARFQDISRKMQTVVRRNITNNPDLADRHLLVCVVGVHGNIDLDTGVCLHATHFASWGINNNIHQKLTNQLGLNCPIYLDNWIRLKTYGEKKLGFMGSHDSVVLIDAGWHGVVSGLLLNGELYTGKHYLSGEIGHFRVNQADTDPCFCGSYGCFEKQVQVDRLIERAYERAAVTSDSMLSNKKAISLQKLFSAADAGDSLARELLDDIIYWFSLIISYLLLFFDPEVLIIEGEYADGCKYLESSIKKRLKEITLPRLKRDMVLQFNSNGADSVLKGAALLAVDRYL